MISQNMLKMTFLGDLHTYVLGGYSEKTFSRPGGAEYVANKPQMA